MVVHDTWFRRREPWERARGARELERPLALDLRREWDRDPSLMAEMEETESA
jgi:hypothetical protein